MSTPYATTSTTVYASRLPSSRPRAWVPSDLLLAAESVAALPSELRREARERKYRRQIERMQGGGGVPSRGGFMGGIGGRYSSPPAEGHGLSPSHGEPTGGEVEKQRPATDHLPDPPGPDEPVMRSRHASGGGGYGGVGSSRMHSPQRSYRYSSRGYSSRYTTTYRYERVVETAVPGLKCREGPDLRSKLVARLDLGTRLHIVDSRVLDGGALRVRVSVERDGEPLGWLTARKSRLAESWLRDVDPQYEPPIPHSHQHLGSPGHSPGQSPIHTLGSPGSPGSPGQSPVHTPGMLTPPSGSAFYSPPWATREAWAGRPRGPEAGATTTNDGAAAAVGMAGAMGMAGAADTGRSRLSARGASSSRRTPRLSVLEGRTPPLSHRGLSPDQRRQPPASPDEMLDHIRWPRPLGAVHPRRNSSPPGKSERWPIHLMRWPVEIRADVPSVFFTSSAGVGDSAGPMNMGATISVSWRGGGEDEEGDEASTSAKPKARKAPKAGTGAGGRKAGSAKSAAAEARRRIAERQEAAAAAAAAKKSGASSVSHRKGSELEGLAALLPSSKLKEDAHDLLVRAREVDEALASKQSLDVQMGFALQALMSVAPSKESFMEGLLRDWDINRDGQLSKMEWRNSVKKLLNPEANASWKEDTNRDKSDSAIDVRQIDQMFTLLDTDHSGALEMDEIRIALKKLQAKAAGWDRSNRMNKEKSDVWRGIADEATHVAEVTAAAEAAAKLHKENQTEGALGAQLGAMLKKKGTKVSEVVSRWGGDDGMVDKKEFWRESQNLGLRADREEVDRLFDRFDFDGGGTLDKSEIKIALIKLTDEAEQVMSRIKFLANKAEDAVQNAKVAQEEYRRSRQEREKRYMREQEEAEKEARAAEAAAAEIRERRALKKLEKEAALAAEKAAFEAKVRAKRESQKPRGNAPEAGSDSAPARAASSATSGAEEGPLREIREPSIMEEAEEQQVQ
jgi:Ca2+-binding EF-hand superfamily protein